MLEDILHLHTNVSIAENSFRTTLLSPPLQRGKDYWIIVRCCAHRVTHTQNGTPKPFIGLIRLDPPVTMKLSGNILDSIGNTPLVELRKVVPPNCARIAAKLEWANPTGSMKDRMAKAVIEHAEADGRLPPGGTVVEYTSGTTGVSLAFACASKGYQFHAVFSDAFSDEKRFTMQAFGAHVTDVRSYNKKITEKLIKEMIETSPRSVRSPAIGGQTSSITVTLLPATTPWARRYGTSSMERSMRSFKLWAQRTHFRAQANPFANTNQTFT